MENLTERSGEMASAWLSWFGEGEDLSPESLQACLGRANVGVQLLSPSQPPAGAGIVFAAAATPEVGEFVRDASREGSEQILVLVENNAALAGGAAWRLLDAGASDVLVWHDLPEPAGMVAARLRRWRQVDALLATPAVRDQLVGESRAWKLLLRQVVEAARFTDSPILLMGETGTGKELVAQLIHALDPRRSQNALIVVDCTTLIPDLSGSELFGHEKGSFTGAITAREGAFHLADQGTLFLDEAGELPLSLQVQLLRVLQERTYKRVGSNVWRSTDFRLICATNRDLAIEEEQGRFRRDLYHRIASWTFKLPPLRERPEDILRLAQHFTRLACPQGEPPELDARVREYLLGREYPGNVRDLRNQVFRILSRHVGPGPVTIGDIPADERPEEASPAGWHKVDFDPVVRQALALGASLRELTGTVKESAIRIAVDQEEGNLQRAARRLGVTDRALQLWRAENTVRG